MADQHVMTMAEGLSRPDTVLATKLHVPRPLPGTVARPRLAHKLEEGLTRGLVLVCAPAGSGKTVLLADWVRRRGRPVAWLSLDEGDNDPARFWRHTVAAMGRARPGVGELATPEPGLLAPVSAHGPVAALINELAAQPGDDELLLVLDDYHLIDSQGLHASLLFLLEHLPPGLRLVVASRSDPPLPLARLRARGQLAELRAGELRFTADEAAAMLRATVGAELPAAVVATLAARTEGWAAGLQLAGLSLREQPDAAGFAAAFSGSHRFVLDYLAGEVLERQGPQTRQFLLETSVLERLSGELCDSVTGRADSQAMLEEVERAGLFLVPLDEVRGWWRYHHLFADLLRSRLRQEQPARVAALHRAAAAWHEGQNLADDAVRHALAAGNPVWAAQLIERYFDAVFLPGERTTIRRWLAALPTELVGSRPRLCLAQMCVMLDDGDTRAAGIAAEAAQRASAVATGESFEPSVGRSASLLANVAAAIAAGRAWLAYLGGDADATVALATEACSKLGDADSLLNAFCQLELAVADRLRGRLDDAERGFAASVTSLVAAGARGLAAAVCGYLTEIQMCQGRLDAVLATCQLALKITTPPGEPPSPAAGIAYVAMADVYYQRGDLDAALQYVTEGIRRLRPVNYTGPLAGGLVTLAWIRQANGDTAGALDAIHEAEQLAPSADVADLANPVPAQRAQLLVVQGNTDAAARWTQQRSLGADDKPGYSQEREYLVLARVLLAQDRLGPARTLLDWLLTQAAAEGRVGSAIEIRALQALAHEASGDGAAAVAALAEALTLACPQGNVRVFANEGPPIATVVGRLVAAHRAKQAPARDIPLGYLARLVQAFDARPHQSDSRHGTAPEVPGLIDPLTQRELQVLAMLAAGTPNQAIARELFVTLDTVKKHVSHVLAKLGAANRTEAVTRARDLGLIP